jgi:ketosteroid isomerase-like protein
VGDGGLMSTDDVAALRRFYELVGACLDEMNANPAARTDIGEALLQRELPRTAAVIDALDPEVEWVPLEAPGAVYSGRSGIISMLQAWYEAVDEWLVEVEEILDAGDALLMTARIRVRGRASGLPVEERLQAVFRMRDGRVRRCEEFSDPAAARQAAGLATPD